jgi:lipopolysaccharide transport system permease protein
MSTLAAELREVLSEQRQYRELLLQFAKRDLLLRYKQTVMGFGWAIFMPLLNTLIFSVIFTRVAPLDVGIPYPVYAYCGLLAWNFFASSLRFSVSSLTANTNLVTKVYFPRETLPFASVIVCLVDFAVASIVLAGLMVYYGVTPSWTIAALPLVVVVHVLFTSAVALQLAMANLFYRDVKYVFEVIVQIWMFATSVLYPVERIGGAAGQWLALNPLTPIIEGYRDVLLLGRWPGLPFLAAAAVSLVLFMWSWIAFHRTEFKFAENI